MRACSRSASTPRRCAGPTPARPCRCGWPCRSGGRASGTRSTVPLAERSAVRSASAFDSMLSCVTRNAMPRSLRRVCMTGIGAADLDAGSTAPACRGRGCPARSSGPARAPGRCAIRSCARGRRPAARRPPRRDRSTSSSSSRRGTPASATSGAPST